MTDERVSAWQNPLYTDEQMGKLSVFNRTFMVTGEPQKQQKLLDQMERSVPYEELDIPETSVARAKAASVRPETNIDVTLMDEPPRVGKGSGQTHWQEFASMVSVMDEEVIEQFTRDELIQILIDRDVIDQDPPKT